MDSVFAAMKAAREAKHISLAEIADATLININFLRAIEEGKTDILPQTYVRAFMREYASFVGLDPAEVMKQYDEMLKPPVPEPPPVAQAVVEQGPPVAPPHESHAPFWSPAQLNPQTAKFAILGAFAVVLGITLWNILSSDSPVVTETPFDTVVKDNEAREGADSVRAMQAALVTGPKAPIDSLTLRAATTDTVWMQITIDATAPREYLLRPNSRMSWKAKEQFVLTVGKPSAVAFTLNQKPLVALGKQGLVIRNVTITRDNLAKK